MFDMRRIGKKIADLRKENNFTQVELADKLGISYQAVSNWERGDSMPDIAKLEELSQIFDISIDDLLENKRVVKVAQEIFQTNDIKESVSKDDLSDALSIQKPRTVDAFVKNYEQKEQVEQKEIIDDDELIIAVAPFLDSSLLAELVKDKNYSLDTIIAIAPFLDEEDLDELVLNNNNIDFNGVVTLAPFLSEKMIYNVASKNLHDGSMNKVAALAPFMDSDDLAKLVKELISHGNKESIVSLAPFLEEEDLSEMIDNIDLNEKLELLPFLNEEAIKQIALELLEKKDLNSLNMIMPFLDEKSIFEILKKKNEQ